MASRSCSNCIYRNQCKKAGVICEGHNTLEDRIDSVFRGNVQEYNEFTKEWDEARFKLRRLGGLT